MPKLDIRASGRRGRTVVTLLGHEGTEPRWWTYGGWIDVQVYGPEGTEAQDGPKTRHTRLWVMPDESTTGYRPVAEDLLTMGLYARIRKLPRDVLLGLQNCTLEITDVEWNHILDELRLRDS